MLLCSYEFLYVFFLMREIRIRIHYCYFVRNGALPVSLYIHLPVLYCLVLAFVVICCRVNVLRPVAGGVSCGFIPYPCSCLHCFVFVM